VAIGFDLEVGVAGVEDAPQGAALAGGAPAGLVHVQRVAGAQVGEQVLVRAGQRSRRTREDRVDRARAHASAEQLFAQLDRVIAGDTVSDRQRRHRGFKARAEAAARDLLGQPGAGASATAGAAQPQAAVLDDLHVDRC
jgi:hypothetical protein